MLRGLAGAVLIVLACASSARAAEDPCWNLIYRLIEYNAASPHVPYISYNERERITLDGNRFEFASARITYRDDGLAYVDDDRWDHPFVSTWLEPGPPVLGPYGDVQRTSWMAFATTPDAGLPVIANTTNRERTRCVDLGDDTIDRARYAHIVFPDAPTKVPAVKAIWIDRETLEVKRLITSAWIQFASEDRRDIRDLTDYAVDLERINGTEVVQRISWTYSFKVYHESSTLDAEYVFTNYRFDTKPPIGTLFASNGF